MATNKKVIEVEQKPISPELQAKLDERKKDNKQWYAISIMSGKELEVERDLRSRIETFKMQDNIFDILICWNDEPKYLTNRKTHIKECVGTVKKNLYPRYIFVEMIMSDDAWFVVRNTPNVTGLVGSSGKGTKPVPCPKNEMNKILKMCGRIVGNASSDFVAGYNVKITNGPYKEQVGKILEVNTTDNSVIIGISMFGHVNPIRLSFSDVQPL